MGLVWEGDREKAAEEGEEVEEEEDERQPPQAAQEVAGRRGLIKPPLDIQTLATLAVAPHNRRRQLVVRGDVTWVALRWWGGFHKQEWGGIPGTIVQGAAFRSGLRLEENLPTGAPIPRLPPLA